MKNLKEYANCFILFLIGGTLYIIIELIARGHSDLSMFLAGGICFVLIGSLNEYVPHPLSLTTQMFLSTLIITGVELVFGFIMNIWLKKAIWDYSNQPYNFKGQICLLYSTFWFFLSLPAILLNKWLREHLFGEKKETHFYF